MTQPPHSQRPFDAMRSALSDVDGTADVPDVDAATDVRPDALRVRRTGIPEVVFAEGKTPRQVAASLVRLARLTGRALASRCSEEMLAELPRSLRADASLDCAVHHDAHALIASNPAHPERSVRSQGGRIGIITAGTSDIRLASEAGLMASEMGCAVIEVRDVGVAGLHRLVRPLEALLTDDVGAIIVVAGMDGALPSVVAGLVDVPVIGLPSAVGYGFGGRGEAALMTMLQSCAPGLLVVNIDNGIGAGAAAARIANRLAVTNPRT